MILPSAIVYFILPEKVLPRNGELEDFERDDVYVVSSSGEKIIISAGAPTDKVPASSP